MPIRAVYVGYLVFKEAVHRLTGIDREASLAATGFTAGVLATAVLTIASPILRALRPPRPRRPSLATCIMGASTVRYGARSIAGDQPGATPFGDAIIVSALATPAFRLVALPVQIVRAALTGVARAWRYVTLPQLKTP